MGTSAGEEPDGPISICLEHEARYARPRHTDIHGSYRRKQRQHCQGRLSVHRRGHLHVYQQCLLIDVPENCILFDAAIYDVEKLLLVTCLAIRTFICDNICDNETSNCVECIHIGNVSLVSPYLFQTSIRLRSRAFHSKFGDR